MAEAGLISPKAMNPSPLADLDNVLLDGLQFCSRVYALFEQARLAPGGPTRMRSRASKFEKRLLEELLPICKYIQAKYRVGRYISVRWTDGSQQYDAEVHQRGTYVEANCLPPSAYLEVTCVMHKKEHLRRMLLDSGGVAYGLDSIRRVKKTKEIISHPVTYRNDEFVGNYSTLVLDRLRGKAGIPYPANTTLIVQCSLDRLYTPGEWDMLVHLVRGGSASHSFREVFMYDAVYEYSQTL